MLHREIVQASTTVPSPRPELQSHYNYQVNNTSKREAHQSRKERTILAVHWATLTAHHGHRRRRSRIYKAGGHALRTLVGDSLCCSSLVSNCSHGRRYVGFPASRIPCLFLHAPSWCLDTPLGSPLPPLRAPSGSLPRHAPPSHRPRTPGPLSNKFPCKTFLLAGRQASTFLRMWPKELALAQPQLIRRHHAPSDALLLRTAEPL